jgi:hypothetical protein
LKGGDVIAGAGEAGMVAGGGKEDDDAVTKIQIQEAREVHRFS